MCKYATLNKRGMTQWLTCNIDGEFCGFQRVCHETKSIINTTTYVMCPKPSQGETIIDAIEELIAVERTQYQSQPKSKKKKYKKEGK